MRKLLFFIGYLLIPAAPPVLTAPAQAHHSPAMFDSAVEITLTGTVREFQWTSPHCWIQVLVPSDEAGAPAIEWSVEMDNPLGLLRHGWKPVTLQPGDEVVVVAHPLRDGSLGAQVVSVTWLDGTPVTDGRQDSE